MSSTDVVLWREGGQEGDEPTDPHGGWGPPPADEGEQPEPVDYAAQRAERARRLAVVEDDEDDLAPYDDIDEHAGLAVRPPMGELLLYAPGRAIALAERHVTRTVAGGIALVRHDWQSWANHIEHALRLDHADTIAGAAGKNLNLSHRKDHHERVDRRKRFSWRMATLALLGVFATCVAGYDPHVWPPIALGLFVILGCVGLFSGDRSRAEWCRRLILAPALLLPLGITELRWQPAAGALALVIVAAWWRGGHVAPPEGPATPGGPPLPVRNWQVLWATAHRVLAARAKVVERTGDARPISADGEEMGVGIGARCTEAILAEDVRAVERELGLPERASSWVADPQSAGSGELRLLWADPLPPRTLPRREPMSLTYTGSFVVAHRSGGRVTALSVNRTRILLAGNSGSGKSQSLQDILDAVCDMPDARWSAIDRQEGPTFKAYQHQWNCTGVYYSRQDAIDEVRRLRALCLERNRLLDQPGGMDADLDGEVDQWWVVDPTGEDPERYGHVLFIDELSSATTDKEFAAELTLLLEVCRKGSVSVVMASPDLDTNRVPRAVLDQVNTTCGFACPFSDSIQMFGKGSSQSGWEPYALVPATDDEPNDAGKAFIRGGPYNLPEVHRFGAMDKHEIVARNARRRQWREQHLGEVARPFGMAGGTDRAAADAHADDVINESDGIADAVEVPPEIAAIEEAMGEDDWVTSAAAAAVAGMSAQKLAAAVAPYGLAPGKWRDGSATVRGYTRKDLNTALENLG